MKNSAFKIYFFQETMYFVFKNENFWELQFKWSLLFFFRRFAHAFSLTTSAKVCAENFFIPLQLEVIKENFKRSDFYMLQETRLSDFSL